MHFYKSFHLVVSLCAAAMCSFENNSILRKLLNFSIKKSKKKIPLNFKNANVGLAINEDTYLNNQNPMDLPT